MRTPEITRAPDMPAAVEGMVSLRGELVPVIDLAKYAGIALAENARHHDRRPSTTGRPRAFLVEAVDTILRIDWSYDARAAARCWRARQPDS